MKKFALRIIGHSDDEDRTEYVADESTYNTREEALAEKRRVMGPDGIWSECDVYATIDEVEIDEFLGNRIAQEISNRMDKNIRGVTLCQIKDWVFDAWAEYPMDRAERESILSSVLSDYIIKCAVRGLVPKTGYTSED